MRRALVLFVLAAAGCEARIGEGFGANNGGGGGGGDDDPIEEPPGEVDAGIEEEPIDAMPPAPACANGRKLYLNFEGVTLSDAATSDATLNRASWMTINQGTAPRYKTNAADRDQQIQAIVTGIRSQLAAYPIEVVTTRPATGPYVMIVFGGAANQVGSQYGGAVNTLDCNDVYKSDVAWISDSVGPTQKVVNFAIGAIGFGLGLTATEDPQGCMCGWDNNCDSDNSAPCRLSANIARDNDANQRCSGVTTQNEVAAFETKFCQ
jgi:hypothetical protein